MTIPTWNVTCIFAHHLLGTHNHVFQNLVQCVPNVQMPIRIWRAIMQDKRLAARFFAQALINANFGPTRQPFWLAFRQARTHWEIGYRQVDCLFVFRCVSAHIMFQSWEILLWIWCGANAQAPFPDVSEYQIAGPVIRIIIANICSIRSLYCG